MKKLLSFILAFILLLSSLIGTGMLSAYAEEGNPDAFTADFSQASTQWSGDRVDQLGYNSTTKAYDADGTAFGNKEGQINGQKSGAITTNTAYDFGERVDANFSYTTIWANGDQINISRDAYVQIGLFKIILCDYQTRIVVQYNGTDIAGQSVCSNSAYSSPCTRNYKASFEKGNIKIESENVTYTSSFSDFDAINNAQVSLAITETWQIATTYFGSLTVCSHKNSFSSDFTTANGWEGSTANINTSKAYFGSNDGWATSTARIVTDRTYSLGNAFDAEFRFYTYSKNPSYDPNATLYRIKIGGFEINIKDFQSVLQVKYNGTDINGTTYAKTSTAHTGIETRDFDYTLHVEPGYLVLESDILVYTAKFNGYSSLDNATVSIEKIESWHIWTGYVKNLSVTGECEVVDAGDINADGSLNALDAALLRKVLISKETPAKGYYSDVNRDGARDVRDLVALKKIFVNLGINGNPTAFSTDFTDASVWEGETALVNTEKSYFGTVADYSETLQGTVTAKQSINLGKTFKAQFKMETDSNNGYNPNNEMSDTNKPKTGDIMRVQIGDFRLDIHDYQNQLKLYYKDTLIGESAQDKYSFGWKRVASYKLYVSDGAISVQQFKSNDVLTQSITSDLSGFDLQSNAKISLTKAETWHIWNFFISDFSVARANANAKALTETFTSTENWSGDVNKIDTAHSGNKPNDVGAFGESLSTQGAAYSIKSVSEYDFGSAFSGEFTLYTGWSNTNTLSTAGMHIKIGNLKLRVDGMQNRIALYNGDTQIAEAVNSTYNSDSRTLTYKFSFAPNNIVITQCELSGTETGLKLVINDFDYVPLIGTKVEILKTSTWEWFINRLYDLTIESNATKYAVNSLELQNGTLSADKKSAQAGETVTVAVAPESGYELLADSLYYTYELNGKIYCEQIENNDGAYSFTMPAAKVTLAGRFAAQGSEYVVTTYAENGKLYKNNAPYLLSGIQAQTVRILENGMDSDYEYGLYLKPIFEKAKSLSYNTLLLSIGWKNFEKSYDNYDYSIVEYIYKYANEYDIDVQIVWFGSDVCGGNEFAPLYILNDTATYPTISNADLSQDDTTARLDYSDADLVAREKKAVSELVNAISIYDTEMRTVAIQLENELNAVPNSNIEYVSVVDTKSATAANVDKYTWAGGQKTAILNLVSELANIVKTNNYRFITRINYVTYNCYLDNCAASGEMQSVYAASGVDAIGVSAYGDKIDDGFSSNMDFAGNPYYIAESSPNAENAPKKMLYALANSNGILQYELCYVEGYSKNPLYLIKRDGSYSNADLANSIIGINKMLGYFGDTIASATARSFDEVGVFTFETANATYYYALGGGTLTAGEIGYISNGTWIKIADGSALTSEQAGLGYVIRTAK